MAITLSDSAISDDQPGSSPWSPTMPTHTTDDLLVAVVSANLDAGGLSQSGWTQLGYPQDYASNSLLTLYKIATSGAETLSITDTGSQEKIAVIAAFTGVDTASPVDTAWAYTATTTTAPTHAGLTSTNAGVAVAMFGHDDGSDNGQNGPNNGTATGWTSVQEDGQGRASGPFGNPSNGGAGVGMAYKTVAATTASGNHEWLLANSEGAYSGTVIFAEGAGEATTIEVPTGPWR